MSDDPRQVYRQSFAAAWHKQQQHLPLTPLEQQIVAVLEEHPEYLPLLDEASTHDLMSFETEHNPYLHMGLHLTLRDQLQLDRPTGIRTIFTQLQQRGYATHDIEHRMMECLQRVLWHAYSTGNTPRDTEYLQQLQMLLERSC